MGNILKITVGNYLNSVPGVLTSISLKPSFEAGWDINRTIDGTIIKPGETEYVGQLPRMIDVSMNFTPIHDFAPVYGVDFINYQKFVPPVSITSQENDESGEFIPPAETFNDFNNTNGVDNVTAPGNFG